MKMKKSISHYHTGQIKRWFMSGWVMPIEKSDSLQLLHGQGRISRRP